MTDIIEAAAHAMWQHEGARAGTPTIAAKRTPEAFAEEDEGARSKWLGLAKAALTAIAPIETESAKNFDALMIKAQEAVDAQAAALFEIVVLKAEKSALTGKLDAAEAQVKLWGEYGSPSALATLRDQALLGAKAAQARADHMQAKLHEANLRGNAAEARASSEQKKREAAEASLAEIGGDK